MLPSVPHPSSAAPHHCPRCDYDLSGETSRWEFACPITGRCPECGLDFHWSDVLLPSRWRLPGFVEHAKGLLQTARWTWRTFWWLPLPWIFWARVKLHHTINLRKSLLALAFALVALFAVQSACNIISFHQHCSAGVPTGWGPLSPPPPTWAYAAVALHPFARPEAITAYTIAPAPPTSGWWLTLNRDWMDLFHLGFPAAVVGWPLMFLALPVTRRRAGVRWAHIRRATLYPLCILVLLTAIGAIGAAAYLASASPPPGMTNRWIGLGWSIARFSALAVDAVMYLFPIWLALWWLLAILRGWRVQRGFFVWLLLQVAVALWATVVVCFAWIVRMWMM